MDAYIYAVLSFSLLLILGNGVIMLIVFKTMSRMAGNSLRSEAAERRDFLQNLERSSERNISTHSEMMAQIHRDERMNQINKDAAIAEAAIEGDRPTTPIQDLPRDDEFSPPGETEVHGSI